MSVTPIPDGTENWGFLVNQNMNDLQGQVSALGDGSWTPQDQGFASWSYDPFTNSATTALSTGVVYMTRIKVPKDVAVTQIHYGVFASGSGLTAGQNFVGIYNSAGTLLVTSADQTAAWGTTGAKATTIPTTILTAGTYDIAILTNATTTGITIVRGTAVGAASPILNANLATANLRSSTSGTGQTSLPPSITMSARTPSITGIWTAIR